MLNYGLAHKSSQQLVTLSRLALAGVGRKVHLLVRDMSTTACLLGGPRPRITMPLPRAQCHLQAAVRSSRGVGRPDGLSAPGTCVKRGVRTVTSTPQAGATTWEVRRHARDPTLYRRGTDRGHGGAWGRGGGVRPRENRQQISVRGCRDADVRD